MKTRYIVCGIVQKGDLIVLGKKHGGKLPFPDVWHTPGGGADNEALAHELFAAGDFDNEYFHSELVREIKEELDLEIENIRCIVPKFRKAPREAETKNKDGEMTHYYFLEYLCDYQGGELKAGSDLAEAKWVHKDKLGLVELTPPSAEMYRELGWIV